MNGAEAADITILLAGIPSNFKIALVTGTPLIQAEAAWWLEAPSGRARAVTG